MISLVLEGILSKVTFGSALFVLLSLIFFVDKKYYLYYSFLIGLLYDILYNPIFINFYMFLIISYILLKIKKNIEFNYINTLLISILLIIIYRISQHLILFIFSYTRFNIVYLFKSIYMSFFINISYVSIIYVIKKYVMHNTK